MPWIALLFVFTVVILYGLPRLRWIQRAEAARQLRKGALLVDVRSKAEFRDHRIPGSRNCPLPVVGQEIRKLHPDPGQPILLFCHSGMRSAAARRRLHQLGFTNVANLGSYSRARKVYADAARPTDNNPA